MFVCRHSYVYVFVCEFEKIGYPRNYSIYYVQFILMFVCVFVCKHSYAYMFMCAFVKKCFIQEEIKADIKFPIYSYVCVWDSV